MGLHRDEIAIAIGYHPAMFSTAASTLDNLGVARELEWMIVVGRNARFANTFSNRLIPASEHGERFYAPDYSDIPELQMLTQKIKNTSDMVEHCRIAVNDAIIRNGLDVPMQAGGHVALVPGAFISAADAAESFVTEG